MTHKWLDGGNYDVKVQAKDFYNSSNSYSQWSQPLPVNIHGPNLEIIKIKGGVGVTVVVKNIGDDTAHNTPWSIRIYRVIGGETIKEKNGLIKELKPGEKKRIKTGLLFNLGFAGVQTTVGPETKQVHGYTIIMGPIVLILETNS